MILPINNEDGSQSYIDNSLDKSQEDGNQDIDLSGTTLSISDGSSVDLSTIITTNISDNDADTKIQTEESTDEDIIRFEVGGEEYFRMTNGRLEVVNTGTSVIIGEEAGENDNFSTNRNVYIGYQTGQNNVSGKNNMAIGYQALQNATSYDNTAIGYQTLQNTTTGEGNLAFGTGAGLYNEAGDENVLIGVDAGLGKSLHDKSYNVMIGFGAGVDNEGDRNVFIGYNAGGDESGSDKLYIDNSNTDSPLIYGDFSSDFLVINGNSSDNTNNRTLFVNGSIGATSAFNNDSDRRLKTNIQTIPNSLNKILQMRGVTYQWKDGRETGDRMGFIAQEVEPILPQVVDNQNDHYTMQYAPITAVLVEAVKEQQVQIEVLKKENQELKTQVAKINELKVMLLKMQAQLEETTTTIQSEE